MAATTSSRGTIIKVPDSTPGLLFVNGEQKPFVMEGIWRSPTAPAANMLVDVEFDSDGVTIGVRVVDAQQQAVEATARLKGMAEGTGKKATEVATKQWISLSAGMGKTALVACIVCCVAWLFIPAWTIGVTDLGIQAGSKSLSLWEILKLSPADHVNPPGSLSILNLLSLVCLAAPFAAQFIRSRQAKYLSVAPLACFVVCSVYVPHEFDQALSDLKDVFTLDISHAYGWYVAGIAAIVIAARALRSGR